MKKGVGAKTAREMFTEYTKENLNKVIKAMGIGPDEAAKMHGLVDKYPRIAAHLTDIQHIPNEQGGLANFSEGFQPGMGAIALTNRAKSAPAHALAHEMTHAAQNIGLKDKFRSSYDDATALLTKQGEDGYLRNPFEVSARRAADHKVPLAPADPDAAAAMEQLLRQAGVKRTPGPVPATVQLRKLRDPY
jgi:hypothetical protein